MVVLYELFIFLLALWLSVSTTISTKHDFRYISFQDLQQSVYQFSERGVVSYSQMLFDVSRNQVLVGARDVLYRLSLPNLKLLESARWPAPLENRTQCINKGQSEEFCHNYVKILLTNGRYVYVCGTNAFSPRCSYRKIENISEVTDWADGLAKCPYSPEANITGFMSENGEYYFGGPTDFSSSDSLISKNLEDNTTIRTKQYNSLWLNNPQFVGSFETEQFVYFLFRETAVEYINCGKIIYSRIARVCKNDPGGHTMLRDNWTTFLKARLNCSVSGEYPFYFNEIQGMSYVPEENVVYATFSTPSNSIAGSAVCAFNLSSIDSTFAGPFKYQEHIGSAWGRHSIQHRDHFECRSSAQSSHLYETSKYQLMDKAVKPTTLSPLHVAHLERFTHISVDVLRTKLHSRVHMIFVATDEGLIKKLSVQPRTHRTCVVEIWQAVQSTAMPIGGLQFLKDTNSLYITTRASVLKIPVHHCSRHRSKDSCINSMDPYCGWNERYESCSSTLNPHDNYWKQSLSSCPILDTRIDGGWSSWSDWSACIHRNSAADSDSDDVCMCQTRECNNPSPNNGGRACIGPFIAVVNCTVHGGWSDWSAWSACSATCGTAVKFRSRSCTNPAPAHGGRVCVGQDRTEAFCAEQPPCPTASKDGSWGPWGEWSTCSAHCGGGIKRRSRRCDPPENGGQYCSGNDMEVEICNLHECPDHKSVTSSEWTSDSNITGEYRRRRFKFVCKAPVKTISQLKLTIKEETQLCIENRCASEENPPKWGPWSPWSECSVSCGKGQQSRSRFCDGKGCQGSNHQIKECHKYPCLDEWGCWSEWSPCNASCGWGVRTRYRSCLGHNCKGPAMDKQSCENLPCDSLLGWGNWTVWSQCDKNSEQHRKRQCRTLNPGPKMCQGANVETRMCVAEPLDDINVLSKESNIVQASTAVTIFVFLGGIAAGVAAAVGANCVYKKKKKVKIPSSPHYMSPKQNPYITMPLQDRSYNNKKHNATTSSNLLQNFNNGTLKKFNEYESATLKRKSNTLNNGHDERYE